LPELPDSWLASCLRKSILRDCGGSGVGGGGSGVGGDGSATMVAVVAMLLLYVDMCASSTLTERFNIFMECSSIHLYKNIKRNIVFTLKKRKKQKIKFNYFSEEELS